MRTRWFGATGIRVPEIAVEGEDVSVLDERRVELGDEAYESLIVERAIEKEALRDAHARGLPVIARARTATEVRDALAHPEVACALVPPERRELRELDLTALTYG